MKLLKSKLLLSLLVLTALIPFSGEARRSKRSRKQSRKCSQILASRLEPNINFWMRGSTTRDWSTKPWGQRKVLRILSMNLYNLYMHRGRSPFGVDARNDDLSNGPRSATKLKLKAAVFLDALPDIASVQEIERGKGRSSPLQVLNKFALEELDGRYIGFTSGKSNEASGMESGFLVKAELLQEYEFNVVSFATRGTSLMGRLTRRSKPVFVRDFPMLQMRRKGDRAPFLYVFSPHLKSKRAVLNKQERLTGWTHENTMAAKRRAELRAQREIDEIVQIISDLRADHPDTPFVISGDFNRDVAFSGELSPFYDQLKLREGLSLGQSGRVRQEERFTSVFFPVEGERELHQLDGNFLSYHLHNFVIDSWVYRYVDESGKKLPIPETYAERETALPSDHYPVIVDIDTRAWK